MTGYVILALDRWLITERLTDCQLLWWRLTEHGITVLECVPGSLN